MEASWQPLRIPPGWTIGWNTFYEVDPSEETKGWFGGSSLFYAVNKGRRFMIDVEWRPEFDPSGNFRMSVHYVPYPRTEKGRRAKEEEFSARGAQLQHLFETRLRSELVRELEAWLERCTTWVIEHS